MTQNKSGPPSEDHPAATQTLAATSKTARVAQRVRAVGQDWAELSTPPRCLQDRGRPAGVSKSHRIGVTRPAARRSFSGFPGTRSPTREPAAGPGAAQVLAGSGGLPAKTRLI